MALVEVGLGGRLDATHAWDGGVAAITNVALDHMAWLGDTIPAIAREKAAIIERGDRAVTGRDGRGARGDPASGATRRRAADRGRATAGARLGPRRDLGAARSPWADANLASRPPPGRERGGRRRGAGSRSRRRGSPASTRPPGAAGTPQRPGRAASSSSRSAGTRSCSTAPTTRRARPPSRSLSTTSGRTSPAATAPTPPPLTLVHGSMADKDVDGIIRALDGAAALKGARIIATQVPGERALPAAELGAPLARRPSGRDDHDRRRCRDGTRASVGRGARNRDRRRLALSRRRGATAMAR